MNYVVDGITVLADLSVPTLTFEVTHLELVVQDALNKLDSLIKEKKPEIIVRTLPVLEVNRHQMVMVFIQLVDNAVKFSGSTLCRIMISADILDSKYIDTLGLDSGKVYHKIQISDNGIGL
jgi:light-regulated signal transduction histidine kinase (bacteriophytochrome)